MIVTIIRAAIKLTKASRKDEWQRSQKAFRCRFKGKTSRKQNVRMKVGTTNQKKEKTPMEENPTFWRRPTKNVKAKLALCSGCS